MSTFFLPNRHARLMPPLTEPSALPLFFAVVFSLFMFMICLGIVVGGCSEETTIVKPSYCVGNCVPCKPLVECKILVDSLRLELGDCQK